MIYRLWPSIFIFSLSAAASVQPISAHITRVSLSQRQYQLSKTPARSTEFNEVPHVSARGRCEDTTQPEALTTPNPLLVPAGMGTKIKVSFIIGADGRVHSPLILESAGSTGDHNVLQTVRTWRYRPATCNGVPTEAEGKIEFSHR
jgi:TonB family protein